uniref:DNA-directed RNA polymerase n=1 Tax=Volvulina compacta TaxID=51721 RepID=A0A6C0RWR5_9CHLO|nr:RNA polymerase beta' subunit [Volvulina compacta]
MTIKFSFLSIPKSQKYSSLGSQSKTALFRAIEPSGFKNKPFKCCKAAFCTKITVLVTSPLRAEASPVLVKRVLASRAQSIFLDLKKFDTGIGQKKFLANHQNNFFKASKKLYQATQVFSQSSIAHLNTARQNNKLSSKKSKIIYCLAAQNHILAEALAARSQFVEQPNNLLSSSQLFLKFWQPIFLPRNQIGCPIWAKKNIGQASEAKPTFFNYTFDKGRLKSLVAWTLKNYGQYKTVELLDNLKKTGFEYATKAGISLGIDDLKIPPKKQTLLLEAEKLTKLTVHQYERADITAVERFQRLIDTWHRTSEQLKQEVIAYFEETDILNPVYMMAFSGARGNISQVRQLVGMRGLMSDPQGKIIDFPIQSNFREGLTLTEYIISSYGARKGIVDTALRTANAGYLTRRLVDVAQHVIISHFDCGTRKGIFITDMKENNKTIVSAQSRIVGRVLAKDIYKPSQDKSLPNFKVFSRNQEISTDLAFEITKITNKVFVRSPLTCNTTKLLCQLCYGWSLAQGNLVSVGETVGVIAAQSIGEPGTQLTMRTFHTGGVFSGDVSDEIRASSDGFIHYENTIPGILIRALDGKVLFLTKGDGYLIFSKASKKLYGASNKKTNLAQQDIKKYKIPAYTILFIRNGEAVKQKQVVAQITSIRTKSNIRDTAELIIKAEFEGLFYAKNQRIQKKIIGPKPKYAGQAKQTLLLDPRAMEIIVKARGWNFGWVLSGKRYELPLLLKPFSIVGDYINTKTVITKYNFKLVKNQRCFTEPHPNFIKANALLASRLNNLSLPIKFLSSRLKPAIYYYLAPQNSNKLLDQDINLDSTGLIKKFDSFEAQDIFFGCQYNFLAQNNKFLAAQAEEPTFYSAILNFINQSKNLKTNNNLLFSTNQQLFPSVKLIELYGQHDLLKLKKLKKMSLLKILSIKKAKKKSSKSINTRKGFTSELLCKERPKALLYKYNFDAQKIRANRKTSESQNNPKLDYKTIFKNFAERRPAILQQTKLTKIHTIKLRNKLLKRLLSKPNSLAPSGPKKRNWAWPAKYNKLITSHFKTLARVEAPQNSNKLLDARNILRTQACNASKKLYGATLRTKNQQTTLKIKQNILFLTLQKIRYHKIGYFHFFNVLDFKNKNNKNSSLLLGLKTIIKINNILKFNSNISYDNMMLSPTALNKQDLNSTIPTIGGASFEGKPLVKKGNFVNFLPLRAEASSQKKYLGPYFTERPHDVQPRNFILLKRHKYSKNLLQLFSYNDCIRQRISVGDWPLNGGQMIQQNLKLQKNYKVSKVSFINVLNSLNIGIPQTTRKTTGINSTELGGAAAQKNLGGSIPYGDVNIVKLQKSFTVPLILLQELVLKNLIKLYQNLCPAIIAGQKNKNFRSYSIAGKANPQKKQAITGNLEGTIKKADSKIGYTTTQKNLFVKNNQRNLNKSSQTRLAHVNTSKLLTTHKTIYYKQEKNLQTLIFKNWFITNKTKLDSARMRIFDLNQNGANFSSGSAMKTTTSVMPTQKVAIQHQNNLSKYYTMHYAVYNNNKYRVNQLSGYFKNLTKRIVSFITKKLNLGIHMPRLLVKNKKYKNPSISLKKAGKRKASCHKLSLCSQKNLLPICQKIILGAANIFERFGQPIKKTWACAINDFRSEKYWPSMRELGDPKKYIGQSNKSFWNSINYNYKVNARTSLVSFASIPTQGVSSQFGKTNVIQQKLFSCFAVFFPNNNPICLRRICLRRIIGLNRPAILIKQKSYVTKLVKKQKIRFFLKLTSQLQSSGQKKFLANPLRVFQNIFQMVKQQQITKKQLLKHIQTKQDKDLVIFINNIKKANQIKFLTKPNYLAPSEQVLPSGAFQKPTRDSVFQDIILGSLFFENFWYPQGNPSMGDSPSTNSFKKKASPVGQPKKQKMLCKASIKLYREKNEKWSVLWYKSQVGFLLPELNSLVASQLEFQRNLTVQQRPKSNKVTSQPEKKKLVWIKNDKPRFNLAQPAAIKKFADPFSTEIPLPAPSQPSEQVPSIFCKYLGDLRNPINSQHQNLESKEQYLFQYNKKEQIFKGNSCLTARPKVSNTWEKSSLFRTNAMVGFQGKPTLSTVTFKINPLFDHKFLKLQKIKIKAVPDLNFLKLPVYVIKNKHSKAVNNIVLPKQIKNLCLLPKTPNIALVLNKIKTNYIKTKALLATPAKVEPYVNRNITTLDKIDFKKIISYIKPPIFDFYSKDPSYSFAYTSHLASSLQNNLIVKLHRSFTEHLMRIPNQPCLNISFSYKKDFALEVVTPVKDSPLPYGGSKISRPRNNIDSIQANIISSQKKILGVKHPRVTPNIYKKLAARLFIANWGNSAVSSPCGEVLPRSHEAASANVTNTPAFAELNLHRSVKLQKSFIQQQSNKSLVKYFFKTASKENINAAKLNIVKLHRSFTEHTKKQMLRFARVVQTNYFSPFEGELLYIKPYKKYLVLNPYENLKTALKSQSNNTKEEKMRMAMFNYYFLGILPVKKQSAKTASQTKFIQAKRVSSPQENFFGAETRRAKPQSSLTQKNIKKLSTEWSAEKGWSRFNLVLTKKDIISLKTSLTIKKDQTNIQNLTLNKVFQSNIKNTIKLKTLALLNKEFLFNNAYNFNLKKAWLKENLYGNLSQQASIIKPNIAWANKASTPEECGYNSTLVSDKNLKAIKTYQIKLQLNKKHTKTNRYAKDIFKASTTLQRSFTDHRTDFLYIPYNSLLNLNWLNIKQKKLLTKNKIGFFCLKGSTFTANRIRASSIQERPKITSSKTWNWASKENTFFNIYSKLTSQAYFLQDMRYSKIKSFSDLQKLHLNQNFLKLNPILDKLSFIAKTFQEIKCKASQKLYRASYNLNILIFWLENKIKQRLFYSERILVGDWSHMRNRMQKAQVLLTKQDKTFSVVVSQKLNKVKLYNKSFSTTAPQKIRLADIEEHIAYGGSRFGFTILLKPGAFSTIQKLVKQSEEKKLLLLNKEVFAYNYYTHIYKSKTLTGNLFSKNILIWLNLCSNLCLLKSKESIHAVKQFLPYQLQSSSAVKLKKSEKVQTLFKNNMYKYNFSKELNIFRCDINLTKTTFGIVKTTRASLQLAMQLLPFSLQEKTGTQPELQACNSELKTEIPFTARRVTGIGSAESNKHGDSNIVKLQKSLTEHDYEQSLGSQFLRRQIVIQNNIFANYPKDRRNLQRAERSINVLKKSGQLMHMDKQKITLRIGQPLVISPNSIIHATHGDFINSNMSVITLTYQQLKTGDIVQGIPKIEQLFEARTTKRGRLFRDNVSNLLTGLFLKYFVKSTYLLGKNLLAFSSFLNNKKNKSFAAVKHIENPNFLFVQNKQNQTIILALALQWAVKQSFYKIQQIIVDGILRVYRSQGVSIADKHVEIIVKQMTSKVRIINSNKAKLSEYSFTLKNMNSYFGLRRAKRFASIEEPRPIKFFGSRRELGLERGAANKNFENKQLELLLSTNFEGPTALFPGEIVDLDFVENINTRLRFSSIESIKYEPIVLGITRASLEVDSFLSAASFQQTSRVLSQAALYKKKDFLKGLKENIIIGNLIPAGTGNFVDFLSYTPNNA